MKHEPIKPGKRKAVNLSLDAGVVDMAKAAGINMSQVSEAAIRAAAKGELDRRWQEENETAFSYWNTWVERNGLPLEKYRLF